MWCLDHGLGLEAGLDTENCGFSVDLGLKERGLDRGFWSQILWLLSCSWFHTLDLGLVVKFSSLQVKSQ